MTETAKKIKARIKPNVSTYTTDGKRYYPGDILEVNPHDFVPDFMEVVKPRVKPVEKAEEEAPKETVELEPPKEEKPKVVTTDIVLPTVEEPEALGEEPTETKSKRRRKQSGS